MNEEILAALQPTDELAGLTVEQLQAGILRVVNSGYDDEVLNQEDARAAAELKAQRKLAKRLAKGKL